VEEELSVVSPSMRRTGAAEDLRTGGRSREPQQDVVTERKKQSRDDATVVIGGLMVPSDF
jgi:hypothetical protein